MATQTNSRYHVLPAHEDDDFPTSPRDHLLPTSISLPPIPRTFSFTIMPLVVLRTLSTILALTAFIIFVIDGGDAFISADIFLMLIIIVNLLMLIHYCITQLVKVTVEVRRTSYDIGSANKKPKISMYLDLAFAGALALSLIIGNAVQHWYGGAWRVAVVIGYIVVALQVVLVVPGLESKSVTVTFKINDVNGKNAVDAKLPSEDSAVLSGADTGAARRRGTPESEVSTSTPASLV